MAGRGDLYRHDRGNVSTWIVATARSRAIDKHRSRKARRVFDPVGDDDVMGNGAEILPDPGVRQDDLDQWLVGKAFDSLAVDQRVVIEMTYYEGMSQREIVEALQEPLGTMKTRIRRSGLLKPKQALISDAGN